ncbi:uncharacterized protein ACBR49_012152 [Aulostomus maculatus]
MDKALGLILLLVLFLHHKGNTEAHSSCPYKCQCFSLIQVLCADERMTSAPTNLSMQVKELIIMTSAIEYLFPNSFDEVPQLNKLIFFNNALRSIHSQAFQHQTELRELEISGNPWLDHLFLGTFSKQGNLTKLQLNYNRFQTVLPGMFNSLKELQTLQMKGNIISDLPTFLFMNLHNLRVLDLSLNNLKQVTRETFSGLAQLEILKLNNNHITNISSDTFQDVAQLKELNLEGNKISQLEDGIFSLTNLSMLNLRGNLLATFSVNVFGFEASNLKELNLRGNRLTELSSLSSLISLTDLNLSSNKLPYLPEDIFRNVTALENLDLSENQLTSLPEVIFSNLFRIQALHLHKNQLSKIDAQLFKDQEFIQQLYLSDNQLQSLPMGLLDVFVLQATVRLHGNPWKCDCHMWYLHDWVLKYSQDIEMLDRVMCDGPDFLRRRPMASVKRDELVCQVSEDERPDPCSCSLQASGDTFVIKCKVDKCCPLTVKVQFQEDDGSFREHIWKNEHEHSQCSKETMVPTE